ncbi:MAG: DUF3048 domain-containing protein [Clostridiales bacterium]|jgi:hypothetical protein|nr:DUF3048 domain-containing protein [Clostridiales bacterium]
MKKFTIVAIMLILLLATLAGSAEGAANTTYIEGVLTRNIKLAGRGGDGSFVVHPAISGESSTTGFPLNKETYIPILVQIDNNLGALPQWGIADADIMYELPIQGGGWTRMTALFSDHYPDEAGPLRSARVMHADLREEWDAVLAHFGQQEAEGSNVKEVLRNYGVTKKGLDIDGIGNKYKDYYERVRYHAAPHNVTVYASKLSELMAQRDYTFPVRPFLFGDDPIHSGPAAEKITINHKGNPDTASAYVYDTYSKSYQRHTVKGPYMDLMKPEQPLSYANVIVQRTRLTYNNSSLNPLLPDVVGGGAADIFIGGRYIAGAWARNKVQERTVFFDQDGQEIVLQRGKTWICIADTDTVVSFEGDARMGDDLPVVQAVDASTAEELTSRTDVSNDSSDAGKTVAQVQLSQSETSAGTETEVVQSVRNTATVDTSNKGPVNMRRSGKGNSEIVDRIPNGTVVEVTSTEEEWTKVRFGKKEGFVMTKYLQFAAGN